MTTRETLIQSFLQITPWTHADRFAMASDASGRSYERLTMGDKTAILMNSPYESGEDVRPFVAVTNMLAGFGLTPPKILAQDIKNGFLLLSDLGNDLFAHVCKRTPTLERSLYAAAIDVLVALHKNTAPKSLPPYDDAVYLREAKLLTQWYMHVGDNAVFDTICAKIFSKIPSQNPVLVMRDYHAENLLWLADGVGVNRVGLLDYQDALAGHSAYDLVSLLEDARRDTTPALRTEMLERYITNSGVDRDPFLATYAVLGAQRNMKIIGIFARLSLRDGKARYIDLIPRVWDHLMHDLEHPACGELSLWIAENAPPPSRAYLATLVTS